MKKLHKNNTFPLLKWFSLIEVYWNMSPTVIARKFMSSLFSGYVNAWYKSVYVIANGHVKLTAWYNRILNIVYTISYATTALYGEFSGALANNITDIWPWFSERDINLTLRWKNAVFFSWEKKCLMVLDTPKYRKILKNSRLIPPPRIYRFVWYVQE